MKYLITYNEKGQIYSVASGEFVEIPQNSNYIETDLEPHIITNEYAFYENNIYYIGARPSAWYVVGNSPPKWVEDTEAKISITKSIQLEKRNQLLKDSDWTQLSDIPAALKEKWVNYRQQLRDVTLQFDYPFNVVWPTPPQ